MPFDPTSAADMAALKTELETDPATVGYTGDDATDNLLLNDDDPGAPGSGEIDRDTIPKSEIMEAVALADWDAATASEREYVTALATGEGSVSVVTGSVTRTNLLAIFGAGTDTRTNLAALLPRTGSRLEVLYGSGSSSTPSNVADARRMP